MTSPRLTSRFLKHVQRSLLAAFHVALSLLGGAVLVGIACADAAVAVLEALWIMLLAAFIALVVSVAATVERWRVAQERRAQGAHRL